MWTQYNGAARVLGLVEQKHRVGEREHCGDTCSGGRVERPGSPGGKAGLKGRVRDRECPSVGHVERSTRAKCVSAGDIHRFQHKRGPRAIHRERVGLAQGTDTCRDNSDVDQCERADQERRGGRDGNVKERASARALGAVKDDRPGAPVQGGNPDVPLDLIRAVAPASIHARAEEERVALAPRGLGQSRGHTGKRKGIGAGRRGVVGRLRPGGVGKDGEPGRAWFPEDGRGDTVQRKDLVVSIAVNVVDHRVPKGPKGSLHVKEIGRGPVHIDPGPIPEKDGRVVVDVVIPDANQVDISVQVDVPDGEREVVPDLERKQDRGFKDGWRRPVAVPKCKPSSRDGGHEDVVQTVAVDVRDLEKMNPERAEKGDDRVAGPGQPISTRVVTPEGTLVERNEDIGGICPGRRGDGDGAVAQAVPQLDGRRNKPRGRGSLRAEMNETIIRCPDDQVCPPVAVKVTGRDGAADSASDVDVDEGGKRAAAIYVARPRGPGKGGDDQVKVTVCVAIDGFQSVWRVYRRREQRFWAKSRAAVGVGAPNDPVHKVEDVCHVQVAVAVQIGQNRVAGSGIGRTSDVVQKEQLVRPGPPGDESGSRGIVGKGDKPRVLHAGRKLDGPGVDQRRKDDVSGPRGCVKGGKRKRLNG